MATKKIKKPRIEDCPCCGYHYGSYLPRHCPDTNTGCGWFQCKECGAASLADGSSHINDRPHVCREVSQEGHNEAQDPEEAR